MRSPEVVSQEEQLFALHEKLKKQKPKISAIALSLLPVRISSQYFLRKLYAYKETTDEVGKELCDIMGISDFFDHVGFVRYFSVESIDIYLRETSRNPITQLPFMGRKTISLISSVENKISPPDIVRNEGSEENASDYGLSEQEKKEEAAEFEKWSEQMKQMRPILSNAAVSLASAFSEPQLDHPTVMGMISFHSKLIKSARNKS